VASQAIARVLTFVFGENKDQRDDNDRYGFLIPMQDDTDRLFLARAFARTVHHAEQIRLHERLIG